MRLADYRNHRQTRKRINLRDGGELPQFYLMKVRKLPKNPFEGASILPVQPEELRYKKSK